MVIQLYIYIWGFPQMGVPQNRWFMLYKGKSHQMDNLGALLFLETYKWYPWVANLLGKDNPIVRLFCMCLSTCASSESENDSWDAHPLVKTWCCSRLVTGRCSTHNIPAWNPNDPFVERLHSQLRGKPAKTELIWIPGMQACMRR